jgi:riboflavin kinase/FMN adenylyltransferase
LWLIKKDIYLCPMRVYTDLNQLPEFQNAVITIGSFDGVHSGHLRILNQLKTLASKCQGESVVITFHPHPRTVLRADDSSFKLITSTAEKTKLIAAAGVDNLVIVPFTPEFAQQSAQEYIEHFLVQRFHPAYIVIGYDHRFGNHREGGIEMLQQFQTSGGYEVVEISAHEIDEMAVSSTKIRRALDASEIEHANRLLGYSFMYTGTVVHGQQIGRTIGFPTANLELDDSYKLVLPNGIYAAETMVEGHTYLSMLYIGDRPTIQSHGKRVIEVNLIGFDGDLYGTELQLSVHAFIRPDQRLDGLDALKIQIESDKQQILARLKTPAPLDNVAIVILNYNTRRHLETYLPSVVANSAGARILVADNGSPDDSLEFLHSHYPDITVIDLKNNTGFAEGYNQALKQVNADIYVILNSDVEVSPGWMAPVLKAMAVNPQLAIAQPKILSWHNKQQFEYAGAAGGWIDALGYPFCRGRIFSQAETDQGQYESEQSCFWAAGAAFFIRAPLYHAFGGFDSDYFAHNEEIDLCWRIKRAGFEVRCIPASVVYHLGGGTLEYENPRKVFLNFRNSLFTLLKNESVAKLCWLLPARFLLDGAAGFRFAVKGQFSAIWAIVRAHFSFYAQWRHTLQKRAAVAIMVEQHRVGPPDMRGVYSGSIVFQHYIKRIKTFGQLIQSNKDDTGNPI